MVRSQLTLAQRYEIYAYLQAGISNRRIASLMDVHHSTVSREISRNSSNGKYHPDSAHRLCETRHRESRKYRKISQQTWHIVEKLLRMDFSPEQIAGFLRRSGIQIISHETIYKHVLADKTGGGTLWKHLRWSAKKRRKRYGKQDRRGLIPDRVSISDRPQIVDSRSRIGDWEIDTAIGKGHQGVLIVAVERKSKLTLIGWSRYKKAGLVTKEIIKMFKPYKKHVLTITVDNGKEFTRHKTISKVIEADVYFANPYSPWERGLNENTVGLVRQYFPKNESLKIVDPERITSAQDRLNIRPRKTLDFRSPIEVFFQNRTVAFGT